MEEGTSFVIRRFDDLGRIVIPKEIRRKLNLLGGKVEGFPMRIYEQDGKIILEKAEEEKFFWQYKKEMDARLNLIKRKLR